MSTQPLYRQVDAVIASIAGSTCARDFPALAEFVELHLHAAEGRARAAAERSRERSQEIRAAIGKAASALPLALPLHQLTAVTHRRLQAHPSAYGLERSPAIETIRDELRSMQTMQIEAGFGTETPQVGRYASTRAACST